MSSFTNWKEFMDSLPEGTTGKWIVPETADELEFLEKLWDEAQLREAMKWCTGLCSRHRKPDPNCNTCTWKRFIPITIYQVRVGKIDEAIRPSLCKDLPELDLGQVKTVGFLDIESVYRFIINKGSKYRFEIHSFQIQIEDRCWGDYPMTILEAEEYIRRKEEETKCY